MLLHAQHGFRGTIMDLETGRPVPKVIWYDDALQELEAYQTDQRGEVCRDLNGDYLTYRARGCFRYYPQQRRPTPELHRIVMGAPTCARCGSTLTLPGSDLCTLCNARDRGLLKTFKVLERLASPLLNHPCEHKGCGRLAEYMTGDEVVVTPAPGTKDHARKHWLFERGQTVARHWWCAFHFVPPRILDAKGEVMAVDEEAGGVRPQ